VVILVVERGAIMLCNAKWEVGCPIALGLIILSALAFSLPSFVGAVSIMCLFLWGVDLFGFGNPY